MDIQYYLESIGVIILTPILLPIYCGITLYIKGQEYLGQEYLQRRRAEECIIKLSKYIDYETCEQTSDDFCIEMVKDKTMLIIIDKYSQKSNVCNSIKSGYNIKQVLNYLILIVESDNINYDRICYFYRKYTSDKIDMITIINLYNNILFDIQNEMIILNGYYGLIGKKFDIQYIHKN
jgi:hypothetical protein